MSQPQLALGVVGSGYWGPNLIRNCAELGVLRGVCDIDPAALSATRLKYPCIETFEIYEEFLHSNLDAVVIAAPAPLHASLAMSAIKAGKHVFVEKPLALDVAEAESLIEEAAKRGLQLFVGHLLLYHPAVKKLRQMLELGEIGEVLHVRARRSNLGKIRAQESVWWSFAPHDVALILAIFASEPVDVQGIMFSIRASHIWDFAYADFVFDNNRTAHIEVTWADPTKTQRMDVFGTKGVITFVDSASGASLSLTPCSINGISVSREAPKQMDFESVEPLRAEMAAFLDSIRSGEPAETDGREGLAVLRALGMLERSARTLSLRPEVAAAS